MFKAVQNKSSFLLSILCTAVLLFSGCRKNASEEIDFGTFTNSVYQNHYFGLTMPIPKDWSIQDQEQRAQIIKAGGRMVYGDDKHGSSTSTFLFAVYEYATQSQVPFDASIASLAEKVQDYPNIKNGNDYLHILKNLQSHALVKFSYPTNNYMTKLGGVNFDVMECQFKVNGYTVSQKYYVTIMKGYALGFITSSATPNQEASLQKILGGITFK